LTAAGLQRLTLSGDVPPGVSRRVEQALAEASRHGATRLRDAGAAQPWRRAAWSAAAVAAATLVAIVLVAPAIRDSTTVSASEILARSADRLAQPATSGVELLEYELTLDGVPRAMMPDHVDGAYRVRQVIDHDQPGRYFVATYDASGRLHSSVAQDPANKRRVMTVRLEDQAYRFEFTLPSDVMLSPPELERLHMEATVGMMQASGAHDLQVIETAAGRQYRIEVPHVNAQAANAVWDLTEARVVVDADDYHIVEFAATGTFLKQPYSVSYRLISRALAKHLEVRESDFDLPPDADAIRFQGDGSAIPLRDVVVLALRELARARRAP
jgi:hypothetical protein